jgi:fructose-bisphosphate aldolase class II
MLISMKELLKPTRQHGFAIGAFNVADSCFIRAVVEEAEATNTPAIISIHPSEHDFVGDSFFGYVRDITMRSPVPFTLHLDHGASVEHVLRAIQCGFTSVMIDGSLLPYEENVALTKEVVRLAHAVGVSVEGDWAPSGRRARPWKAVCRKSPIPTRHRQRILLPAPGQTLWRWRSVRRMVSTRKACSRSCK